MPGCSTPNATILSGGTIPTTTSTVSAFGLAFYWITISSGILVWANDIFVVCGAREESDIENWHPCSLVSNCMPDGNTKLDVLGFAFQRRICYMKPSASPVSSLQ
jgi:hypothetical protein